MYVARLYCKSSDLLPDHKQMTIMNGWNKSIPETARLKVLYLIQWDVRDMKLGLADTKTNTYIGRYDC